MERTATLASSSIVVSERSAIAAALFSTAATILRRPAGAKSTPGTAAGPPTVRAWVGSHNERGATAMAELYADDGLDEDVPHGLVARGEEIQRHLTASDLRTKDSRLRLRGVFHGGQWVVIEYDIHNRRCRVDV